MIYAADSARTAEAGGPPRADHDHMTYPKVNEKRVLLESVARDTFIDGLAARSAQAAAPPPLSPRRS